jgi:hypothetical protein
MKGVRRVLGLAALSLAAGAAPPDEPSPFEYDLFKDRFEHEIRFRAAAVEVAWAAEALCDDTTEIEPFVLWSTHTLRKGLSAKELAIFQRATGMDEHWRVAWLDEGAPDALNLGDVVVAFNGRPLPKGETRIELGAIFSSRSMLTFDDEPFWKVVLQARAEAAEGKPMTVTLKDGRELKVETQTGCAGGVTASAFDADADVFWRQGHQRSKIPANAMLEARSRDEFRWLAAFGTYFQASEAAIGRAQQSETHSTAFLVGKILTFAVPGSGMLLTAVEQQTQKAIAVDSIVGSADLFANEVVTAMDGDPAAGLRLSERMVAKGMKVDAVMMGEFRRSNAEEHARRLVELRAAQERAQAETDRAAEPKR